jgi:preprotein translocase subunit YajC
MFITEAFAQTAAPGGAAGGADILMSVLPFLLIFVVMYFLIIRPQRAAT